MSRVTAALVAAALALAVLPSFPASAASLDHPVSVHELVDTCEGAVRGWVLEERSFWDDGVLHTRYTIRVGERIFGPEAGELVTVVLPGGRTGDLIVRASGVPVWTIGDEVVVFLRSDGKPSLRGLFTVDREALVDPLGQRVEGFPRRLPELRRTLGDLTPWAYVPGPP